MYRQYGFQQPLEKVKQEPRFKRTEDYRSFTLAFDGNYSNWGHFIEQLTLQYVREHYYYILSCINDAARRLSGDPDDTVQISMGRKEALQRLDDALSYSAYLVDIDKLTLDNMSRGVYGKPRELVTPRYFDHVQEEKRGSEEWEQSKRVREREKELRDHKQEVLDAISAKYDHKIH